MGLRETRREGRRSFLHSSLVRISTQEGIIDTCCHNLQLQRQLPMGLKPSSAATSGGEPSISTPKAVAPSSPPPPSGTPPPSLLLHTKFGGDVVKGEGTTGTVTPVEVDLSRGETGYSLA